MTTSLAKIIITGGNGQIAHSIARHPLKNSFQLIGCSRQDLDITHLSSIEQAIEKYQPHIIINTAAYTAVDKAETEREQAKSANVDGAENLAKMAAKHNIILLQLSSDYVFDGSKNAPYKEDDVTNPINYYGLTKLLGEEAIRKYCEKHIILRVSGVFSAYGTNFYNTIQKLAASKKPLRVVADQITCPTYADDIAGALLTMAKKPEAFGTYHFCSTPPVSWHHFAEVILQEPVTAITTAEYPTAAKRPSYSALDCEKIEKTFGIKQPSWERAIWALQ